MFRVVSNEIHFLYNLILYTDYYNKWSFSENVLFQKQSWNYVYIKVQLFRKHEHDEHVHK